MMKKHGTDANFRPKRSIMIPAGMNSDMSMAAEMLMIAPMAATSRPRTPRRRAGR